METDPPKQTKATDKETDPPKQTKAADKETDPPKQSKATDMETNPPKQAKATDKETHPPKQSKATDMETNPPKQAKATDVETDPPKQTIASSQDHLLQVPISSEIQLNRGQRVYLSAGNLYEVEIEAPQLEVLDIDESIFAKFKIGNFKYLQEVKLQSGFYEAKRQLGEVGELLVLSRGVFDTINKASLSTSCLVVVDGAFGALSFTFMDYLFSGNEGAIRDKFRMTFPDFYCVTSLRLCIADSAGWVFMPYLLAHLPTLQRLDLEFVDREDVRRGKKFDWNPPKDCLGWCLPSLKHVRLIGFGEKMMEEAGLILAFVREAATEERFEEITITYV
ncbi:hypothetical protein GBA52_002924 [Prunus armeniaca]|nr:hypothetical protein GBA52_002924 [Prunus armeniaca]